MVDIVHMTEYRLIAVLVCGTGHGIPASNMRSKVFSAATWQETKDNCE